MENTYFPVKHSCLCNKRLYWLLITRISTKYNFNKIRVVYIKGVITSPDGPQREVTKRESWYERRIKSRRTVWFYQGSRQGHLATLKRFDS